MDQLKNHGFKLGTWQANEGLTIGFAYRITKHGIVLLGQGDANGNDPFNYPTEANKPVSFCFIPAVFAKHYDHFKSEDGLGRAYTEGWPNGHATELVARDIESAYCSAALLLDGHMRGH